MKIKFIFDDGSTLDLSEGDWTGTLVHYDLERNVMWMESCNSEKKLIQAMSERKMLYFTRGNKDFSVDSERIVEAKVIEDGEEALLWRRVVCSSY